METFARGRAALLVLGLAAIAVGGTAFRSLAPSESKAANQPGSSLVERINDVCKPGYKLFDWTVGGEFGPGTAGTVKVTCSETSETGPGKDGIYDSYYMAVAR